MQEKSIRLLLEFTVRYPNAILYIHSAFHMFNEKSIGNFLIAHFFFAVSWW